MSITHFSCTHHFVLYFSLNKNGRTSVEVATVSAYSETAATHAPYSSRRNKASARGSFKPTSTYSQGSNDGYSRRGFKAKPQPTPIETDIQSTSLYKFKLNRTPGRWQYKTTPKPRVTIRKNNELIRDEPVTPAGPHYEPVGRSDDGDLEPSGSLINGDVLNEDETGDNRIDRKFPIETIKVEISTPADFKDTYYEIATIKSPYTFQVKNLFFSSFISDKLKNYSKL